MSSLMEELLAKNQPVLGLKEGTTIKACITEIRPNEVLVDIGSKCEGKIPISEFYSPDDLQVGQEIEVFLEKRENKDGVPVLSYDKALQKKNWDSILASCAEGSVVPGRVKSKVKGGLIVSIGVDAFLPSSQVDLQPPKNLDIYVGQTFDFKVVKINTERKNIVISRRELIEEQRQQKRQRILEELQVGSVCRGAVKNITDYGVFIDLDGIDALLHITDMSWGRISHPNEMVKLGEEIEVMVTEIDKEKERIALGLKQMTANPWEQIERKYPVGSTIRGKVTNLVPYGAFIEVEEGVEGLVHITEFSWTKRINKPSEVLKIGDEVTAVVLAIQKQEQRISLGIRQLEANPWDMVRHNYPVGARVRGKVRNLTSFGAFIELEEGIDGMVHVSDISWTRKINHPSEYFKKGDEVDATIMEVDPSQQRISLSIKNLTEDPWENIERVFKVGDVVTGKVAKLTSYGAFIELQNGIDGLVHISQIAEGHVEKIKDVLKMGQEVSARVIKIDKADRRIGLSIKAASYDAEALAAEVKAFDNLNKTFDLASIGDIMDKSEEAKKSEFEPEGASQVSKASE